MVTDNGRVTHWLTIALDNIADVDPAAIAAAADGFTVREVRKGEYLLTAEQPATTIYLVIDGWLREGYLSESGAERIKAFVLPGDLGGSLPDLLSDGPSQSYIVAGSEAVVATLPYSQFRRMVDSSPQWREFEVEILRYVVRAKSRRERELLQLDATGRYRALNEQRSDICEVVPLKYIALYLGITEVHLSRIRRTV